ncbi:amidase signature enzyme [Fusarium phyllophilum]|uniref:Amidase signature enzyme n=1 Tax=Fusarium phyllophilum TaxID=47803 RepID=A0A8H5K2C1_9HYPO|nr:amidase signature enzyme [Fusarium phyllophilum]
MEGSYFATATGLLPVRKLSPDTHAAFAVSLFQSPPQTRCIPELSLRRSSRLDFAPNSEKPLHGLRVGFKDNIDIAGAITFASSLVCGEFHGIKSQNATAIQRLLDPGAVIVSKTGMGQFTDAEDPTSDFVDVIAPRNPRSDAIRSQVGAAMAHAAAGAHDWIDFTIRTHTGGSVRRPAASQWSTASDLQKEALSVEGTLVIHSHLFPAKEGRVQKT